MRTCIKAYMSLNFGQVPPLTTKYALERLKYRCHHIISVEIDLIFFKLAGNEDMHNIMNEFKFWPDRTTDYGVSCPWASKKYPHRLIMGKMAFPLFLCCFFLNKILPWHIGLRWAIVALWATCFLSERNSTLLMISSGVQTIDRVTVCGSLLLLVLAVRIYTLVQLLC